LKVAIKDGAAPLPGTIESSCIACWLIACRRVT